MTVRKWGNETIIADANASIFLSNDKGLDITTLSDGSYIVSWIQQDGFIVQAQKFNASGQPVGDIFEIGASVTGATKTDIVLTATDDGGFAAAFTNSANSGDSWYETYDANGAVVRTTQWDTSSNALTEQDPAIASDGDFIFLAESDSFSDGNVYLQMRKISDGSAAAINGAGTFMTLCDDAATGSQSGVNIALSGLASEHSLAAVWLDFGTNTMRFRLFSVNTTTVNPTVTAVTASLDIAGDVGSMDFAPQVVGLANGGYAVVWHDSSSSGSPDTSSYSVRAKIYSSTGVALTGEITVNSMFNGLQARPDVLALRDGGFLVTFDDMNTGERNISGQMFDAFGNRVGGQFTVNTHTAGTDYDSRITELADGRIVVVWSNQNDGMVRQQILDPRDGVIEGTAAADSIWGHDALGDIINGAGDADNILGLAGNDQIYGGDGNDIINAGKNDDTVFGGDGDDDLKGGNGEDVLYGDAGNDLLSGGRGDDILSGGADSDVLIGNDGADSLVGGVGSDFADYSTATVGVTVAIDGSLAGTGDALGDTFASVENLRGSNFSDILVGGNVANVIEGLVGNDRITGGKAADTLSGGLGNDAFVYNALIEGGDNVLDFSSAGAGNNDRFEFEGDAFGGLAAGTITAAMFQSSNAATAQTAAVRFFYEADTGILRYDADGDNAGAATIIATLQAGATMVFSDIVIT